MKNLLQLIRRSSMIASGKRRQRTEKVGRMAASQRRLSREQLERRELLAGDILASHNYFNAYDVNNDYQITASDALTVVNYLSRAMQSEGELASSMFEQSGAYVDVNADGNLTPADALSVINALARGEGIGEPLIEIHLNASDPNGQFLQSVNGAFNLEVGDLFDLEVGYRDLRQVLDATDPTFPEDQNPAVEPIGLFQLVTDITADQAGFLRPVMYETQTLTFAKTSLRPGSDVTSLVYRNGPGGATFEVPRSNITSEAAIKQSLINALTAFGYTEGTDFAVQDQSTTPDYVYRVRWDGTFGNVDLPDVQLDLVETSGDDFVSATVSVAPVLGSGALNPAAVRENIDFRSRSLSGEANQFFYGQLGTPPLIYGSLDGESVVRMGGPGQLASVVASTDFAFLNDFTGEYNPEPFHAYSFRYEIVAPVTGLNVRVAATPNFTGNEAVLVYGSYDPANPDGPNSSKVPLDMVAQGPTALLTFNVTGDAAGVLSINPASISVDEAAGTVQLTVNRAGGSDGPVTVNFASANGTATAGSDYVAATGTLSFASGETSKTIALTINDDSIDEANETFTVTLSSPTGGANLGATVTSTVTITDNDVTPLPGQFAIDPTTATVNEADGTVTLTVNRSGGSDGAVSVSFATANGTATAGSDYTANSGTLNFATGETSKTIVVAINDDAADEQNENFTVTLSNPTGGATLGAATQATVTIVDNDNPVQPGVLSISPASGSVNENAGTVTYTVTRAGGSDGAIGVSFATANGTATAGQDYAANSGVLSFANGETSKTITVSITDDAIDEPNETFTVTLSNPTGGATLGTTKVSTTTILDNDEPAVPGVLSITPGTTSVNEDAGTVTFIVNRASGTDGIVTVGFATANGTATAGQDYTANSGTLTFANGEASKTISVAIINDTVDESNETFTVTLSNPTGGATLGTTTVSTATIVDNDEAPVPGVLSISPGTTSVNESAGTVTFTVNRTGGTDGAVTVNYATANGTATAGSDYVAKSGTLSFANGESSKTFTVSITDDVLDEPNETFLVNLSGATGGASLGTATSTVTILDNDLPGNIPPSSISGSIFIDHVENLSAVIGGADPVRNGVKDSDEKGMGGVAVRLVSAAEENSSGSPIEQTKLTELNGDYKFDNLAPGTYHVIYDVPNTVIFVGVSNLVRVIPETGGVDTAAVNFPLLGTKGSAINNVDILASSYLRTNATISQISNGGREGGLVSYDASGDQQFVMAYSGYEGVKFAELAMSRDRDTALLTIIEEDGDVLSTLLSSDYFVVSADGRGVQFFGGLNDFNFVETSQMNSIIGDFPTYRDAIDRVLAEL